MALIILVVYIVLCIKAACEPKLPEGYHRNWKLEAEDAAKVSRGEMSRRQFLKNIDNVGYKDFPYAVGNSMAFYSAHQKQATQVLVLEKKMIKQLAAKGNCVFVGRSADLILGEYNPMNVFVYADMQTKIKRCQENTTHNENLNEKEIVKGMKEIEFCYNACKLLKRGFWCRINGWFY